MDEVKNICILTSIFPSISLLIKIVIKDFYKKTFKAENIM